MNAAFGFHAIEAGCYNTDSGRAMSTVAKTSVEVTQPSAIPSCVDQCLLNLSVVKASPGEKITAIGTGFGLCLASPSQFVRLLWDGVEQLSDVAVSDGGFTTLVKVPSNADVRAHRVDAECYSKDADMAASGILASANLEVAHVSWTPGLHISTGQAAPGDTVTVVGTEFEQCASVNRQVTFVRLLWDGQQKLVDLPVQGAGFTTSVTVPSHTAVRDHVVAAACYDPHSLDTSSPILARARLEVMALGGSRAPANSHSASGSTSSHAAGSSSASATTQSKAGSTRSSSSHGSPRSTPAGKSSAGKWRPTALTTSAAGGLFVALLLLGGAHLLHPGRRRRGVKWVRRHVRAVAGSAVSPLTEVSDRRGLPSATLGLDVNHDDPGNQEIKEVAQ